MVIILMYHLSQISHLWHIYSQNWGFLVAGSIQNTPWPRQRLREGEEVQHCAFCNLQCFENSMRVKRSEGNRKLQNTSILQR